MTIKQAISEAVQLFKKQQYSEAIEKLNDVLSLITDKTQNVQEQLDAQHWLGRCHLEQARKTNDIQQANPLFKQAVEYFTESLKLAEKLTTENKTQEQLDAQHWLGRCHLEHASKINDVQQANPLFKQAVEYFIESLKLAEKLTTENKTQKQLYAHHWLGYCYLQQALKTNDILLANPIFDEAVKYFTEQYKLSKKLTTENNIQEQINVQNWLGYCYLQQAIKTNDILLANQIFNRAVKYFTESLKLAEKLITENKIQEQRKAEYCLEITYFEKAKIENNFDHYFKCKKEHITAHLSSHFENVLKGNKKNLKDEICSILTILNIHPIELGSIPLAHYTNPNVGEILFSLNNKKDGPNNKMRMNSATYMNDPTEGKSLLELLGKPEISLENRTEFGKRSAFFSCFSSRVNDLNQFRLYGKEDNVEASGCCIVFNKYGNWLKQPDINQSFNSNLDIDKTESINLTNPTNTLNSQELPLYQVAYIIYVDEYLKCHINTESPFANQKFAIFLPPIGNEDYQQNWYKKREDKLITALKALINKLKEIDSLSLEQKQDLEYILYLFKDFAFRDEEEFRLLRIEDFDSAKITYCDSTNSIFVKYADICGMVDEVILGTNYEKTGQKRKVELFRHKMQKKFPHIKITHSSLPINAPH